MIMDPSSNNDIKKTKSSGAENSSCERTTSKTRKEHYQHLLHEQPKKKKSIDFRKIKNSVNDDGKNDLLLLVQEDHVGSQQQQQGRNVPQKTNKSSGCRPNASISPQQRKKYTSGLQKLIHTTSSLTNEDRADSVSFSRWCLTESNASFEGSLHASFHHGHDHSHANANANANDSTDTVTVTTSAALRRVATDHPRMYCCYYSKEEERRGVLVGQRRRRSEFGGRKVNNNIVAKTQLVQCLTMTAETTVVPKPNLGRDASLGTQLAAQICSDPVKKQRFWRGVEDDLLPFVSEPLNNRNKNNDRNYDKEVLRRNQNLFQAEQTRTTRHLKEEHPPLVALVGTLLQRSDAKRYVLEDVFAEEDFLATEIASSRRARGKGMGTNLACRLSVHNDVGLVDRRRARGSHGASVHGSAGGWDCV